VMGGDDLAGSWGDDDDVEEHRDQDRLGLP
jgi:hypothetical protein